MICSTTRVTLETRLALPLACEVAIVTPVYGNAATLPALAQRVKYAISETRDYRLVFVVDASPDDSWRVIEQLAHADNRVCGVLLDRNVGQHRALLVGLRMVRARWAAIMDGDLQDPPELLPALIEECELSGVTVFAQRHGRYQGLGRMVTSRLFKHLLRMLVDLPANVGAFFIVPEQVAERMRCANVHHPQMVVMAGSFSPDWRVVGFTRPQRADGESAYSGLKRLQSALTALACAWECKGLDVRGPSPMRQNNAAIISRVNI